MKSNFGMQFRVKYYSKIVLNHNFYKFITKLLSLETTVTANTR